MKRGLIALCAIVGVLALGGCSSQTYLTPYTPSQTSVPAANTPTYQNSNTTAPPPTASTTTNKIVIKYSSVRATQIGKGNYPSTPKDNNVYLIVTYIIINSAYNSFSVNPFDFDVIVNNIKYSYATESYSLPDAMDAVAVMKGGTLTCSLAFEIPAGSTSFTPYYDDVFGIYNIQWILQ